MKILDFLTLETERNVGGSETCISQNVFKSIF